MPCPRSCASPATTPACWPSGSGGDAARPQRDRRQSLAGRGRRAGGRGGSGAGGGAGAVVAFGAGGVMVGSAIVARAIPGMPNAHSHAFQRGLRGRAERPGPAGGEDDFWTWRTEMFRARRHARSRRMHAVALETYAEMAARGLFGRRRVPLRPPPARRHPVRRAERDGVCGRRSRGRGRTADRHAPGGL